MQSSESAEARFLLKRVVSFDRKREFSSFFSHFLRILTHTLLFDTSHSEPSAL